MFQKSWHGDMNDAYVYEMKYNLVEAKHLGCYNHSSRPVVSPEMTMLRNSLLWNLELVSVK